MNSIIIDDEEMARAIITQMIETHPDLKLIQEFPNAIQAMKFLNHIEVDLVFLDIQVDTSEHVYPMQIRDGAMRDMWLSKTERT